MTKNTDPGKSVLHEPHGAIEAAHESRLGDERERALLNLVREGDSDARQKIVTRNLRLVLNSTRRYASKGVRFFDLLKAGNLGLAHALENFEREGHGRFSVYAEQCIRQNIEHTILNWDGRHPPLLGNPDHDRYRIVVSDDPNPSVHLIRDPGLSAHDQIN